MAVSGRKLSDFRGSVSRGSAEDFEHSCDSCLTDGQHIEAHGFCTNCQEYLCKNCFRCHQRTKASKHHKLLDKDTMDKQTTPSNRSNVCTEPCSTHTDELIKFFCPKHEELGCHDCMTMNHRTCQIDYITDKCEGIGDSEEFREVMRSLDQKKKDADTIIKRATLQDKEFDEYHDKAIKDILRFRKEINDHLDTMQRKIEADGKKMKERTKEKIQAALDSCTKMVSEIQNLKSSLQANKAANQNAQLFTAVKRARTELQSDKIKQAEILLVETNTQITFKRNTELENLRSTDNFGQLTEHSTAVVVPSILSAMPTRKATFNSLTHKADIKARTNSDKNTCNITSCAALTSDKLVLADFANDKLKVLETKRNVIVEETALDSEPRDITVLPNNQIAVTMLQKKEIIIMNTANKLTKDYSIQVDRYCRGITYHQGSLYVLYWSPTGVLVMDMKGNIKDTISLKDRKEFKSSNYIVLSQDHKHLYISNYTANSVVSLTLQGTTSAVYKDKNLSGPLGMLVLDDGSLLVCCNKNNTIHHISADLKQGRKVADGVVKPKSICCSADKSEVYVGSVSYDQVKVFSLQ